MIFRDVFDVLSDLHLEVITWQLKAYAAWYELVFGQRPTIVLEWK